MRFVFIFARWDYPALRCMRWYRQDGDNLLWPAYAGRVDAASRKMQPYVAICSLLPVRLYRFTRQRDFLRVCKAKWRSIGDNQPIVATDLDRICDLVIHEQIGPTLSQAVD